MNKIHNLKKAYYNFNDDITLNKASNSYSNDTYNIIETKNDTSNSNSNIVHIYIYIYIHTYMYIYI